MSDLIEPREPETLEEPRAPKSASTVSGGVVPFQPPEKALYICDVCSSTRTSFSAFKQHYLSAHGSRLRVSLEEVLVEVGERHVPRYDPTGTVVGERKIPVFQTETRAVPTRKVTSYRPEDQKGWTVGEKRTPSPERQDGLSVGEKRIPERPDQAGRTVGEKVVPRAQASEVVGEKIVPRAVGSYTPTEEGLSHAESE